MSGNNLHIVLNHPNLQHATCLIINTLTCTEQWIYVVIIICHKGYYYAVCNRLWCHTHVVYQSRSVQWWSSGCVWDLHCPPTGHSALHLTSLCSLYRKYITQMYVSIDPHLQCFVRSCDGLCFTWVQEVSCWSESPPGHTPRALDSPTGAHSSRALRHYKTG